VVYAILPAKIAEQLESLPGGAASLEGAAASAANMHNNALIFFKSAPCYRTETGISLISFFGLNCESVLVNTFPAASPTIEINGTQDLR